MLVDVALQEGLVPALPPRRGLLLQHHELRDQDLQEKRGADHKAGKETLKLLVRTHAKCQKIITVLQAEVYKNGGPLMSQMKLTRTHARNASPCPPAGARRAWIASILRPTRPSSSACAGVGKTAAWAPKPTWLKAGAQIVDSLARG